MLHLWLNFITFMVGITFMVFITFMGDTARRKYTAKSCFYVQKKDIGERLTLFRRCLTQTDLGNVDMQRM